MSCDYLELTTAGIRELQPYVPGKPIEELQRELGLTDVIKLASNENPLGPSPQVLEALQRVMPEIARYPDGSAWHLKHKLAEFLGVGPENLTIGNGSNDVLELLARIFLSPANESIVSQHSFVVYPLVTRAIGADLRVVPARNYGQDLEATLNSISPKTRMVFIANPNNPTGTWIDESTLAEFLDQMREDIIVVLDEAYFEYVEAAGFPNGIELQRRYPNLVVTRTFSKAYGLAALRVGYAVSHPDIADLMNRVRQPFNVNAMSLAAAEVALADQDHVKEAVRVNREGLSMLTQACDELGLGYIPSAGNFLAVDFGRDAMPIYDALLHQGVIVRPIGVYEMPNHLRVTVGTADENQRFIEALKRVLAAVGSQ
ncbi:MAG TPA: histidinol-phosphate transaminase [Pseudomonadales bacterium]|nr:histidinol-phosphate transaminase [Pseudomonadales bacterium]